MVGSIIYLCRHGNYSESVAENGLTDEGKQQVEAAARLFMANRWLGPPVSAIYHSSLKRAAQTAQILKNNLRNQGLSIIEEQLLNDEIASNRQQWQATESFMRTVAEGGVLVTHLSVIRQVNHGLCGGGLETPPIGYGGLVALHRKEREPWYFQDI